MKKTLFCESLGCPKNRVDSEVIIAQFLENGWEVTEKPEKARLIILNTCSFINDAREESVSRFFDLHAAMADGAKIAMTGCLPQLYPNIGRELREADFIIGIDEIPRFRELVESNWLVGYKGKIGDPSFLYSSKMSRSSTFSPFTAYLKIADGCNNFCSFCSIPYIRGRYRERGIDDIVTEAKALVAGGIREIVLIAQDTTQYGTKHDSSLAELLKKINDIEGNFRFRTMYLYPSGIDDDLLKLIRDLDKMYNYLEIPIQHISDRVLKSMNRRYTGRDIYNLIERINRIFGDDYLLRTTLLSSFPTETKADHEELKSFISHDFFDYGGVFKYSKEEVSASGKLRAVPAKTAKERFDEVNALLHESLERRLSRFVGSECEMLYEGIDGELKVPTGRCWNQAPEIDGITIVTNATDKNFGTLRKCRIVSREGTDFIADFIK